jgi:hypothetical protein
MRPMVMVLTGVLVFAEAPLIVTGQDVDVVIVGQP